MKGTCVIAWLFSSLGWWRLAQPETDASQCQRAEHPVISYKEIGPWLREFRAKNAVDFSQLTFDPGQKELVVGARNYLFRLQLEDLSLIQGHRKANVGKKQGLCEDGRFAGLAP
uniref:Semaphorin 5A n=1 Tax=Molossus molossus TaxID=27622 RepID=A0A7J8J203_MOLMO|nr:semaphorin 5A [Molossus molossus]